LSEDKNTFLKGCDSSLNCFYAWCQCREKEKRRRIEEEEEEEEEVV